MFLVPIAAGIYQVTTEMAAITVLSQVGLLNAVKNICKVKDQSVISLLLLFFCFFTRIHMYVDVLSLI